MSILALRLVLTVAALFITEQSPKKDGLLDIAEVAVTIVELAVQDVLRL